MAVGRGWSLKWLVPKGVRKDWSHVNHWCFLVQHVNIQSAQCKERAFLSNQDWAL